MLAVYNGAVMPSPEVLVGRAVNLVGKITTNIRKRNLCVGTYL
jgi:hypothetical protein